MAMMDAEIRGVMSSSIISSSNGHPYMSLLVFEMHDPFFVCLPTTHQTKKFRAK